MGWMDCEERMSGEADAVLGAPVGERSSEERTSTRNVYRSRELRPWTWCSSSLLMCVAS